MKVKNREKETQEGWNGEQDSKRLRKRAGSSGSSLQ